MNKVLTVVIPAYNSERFLNTVLDSLLVEDLAAEMEVIVVDDGSSDRTAAVCEQYCRDWPGTVRLISQNNRGHGGALNTGIAAASGTYIKVIDSDDWAETKNLPRFLETLRHCTCDVVLTHFNSVQISDHSVTHWKSYPVKFGCPYTLDEIVRNWDAFHQVTAFHGITYRREFYLQLGFQLTEHVFYEDQEYAILPFCQARSVMPLDLVIYNYRLGDADQSMSEKNQAKNISNYRIVLNRLFNEYGRLPLPGHCAGRDYYCLMMKSLLMSFLIAVMLIGPDRRLGRIRGREIMKSVRSRIPEVYRRARFPYRILRMMSLMKISKHTCDSILNSPFYNRLCHRYDLETVESS